MTNTLDPHRTPVTTNPQARCEDCGAETGLVEQRVYLQHRRGVWRVQCADRAACAARVAAQRDTPERRAAKAEQRELMKACCLDRGWRLPESWER